MLSRALKLGSEYEDFREIIRTIEAGGSGWSLSGLGEGAKAYFLAVLYLTLRRPLLIITSNQEKALQLYDDLLSFWGEGVYLFPSWEILPYEPASPSNQLVGERLLVLDKLLQRERVCVVATVKAISHKLIPPRIFAANVMRLRQGQLIPQEELLSKLVWQGFKSSPMVENRGEFSHRGGIIDIFPSSASHPWRLEFFGDEIESIRQFEVATQRSIDKSEKITILPEREVLIAGGIVKEATKRITRALEQFLEKQDKRKVASRHLEGILQSGDREAQALQQIISEHLVGASQRLRERVEEEVEKLSAGVYFSGIESYLPLLYPELETFFSYLPRDVLTVLDEPLRIEESSKMWEEDVASSYITALERAEILPHSTSPYLSKEEIMSQLKSRQHLNLSLLPLGGSKEKEIAINTVENFSGKWEELVVTLEHWQQEGYRIVILINTRGQLERVEELLEEWELFPIISSEQEGAPEQDLQNGNVYLVEGRLSTGFRLPALKLAVLTENEIFSRRKTRRKRWTFTDSSQAISSYTDLKVSDYVVHINYGIGQYLGTQTLDIEGSLRDYMAIRYADKDRLYIPLDQVDLIQKYIGVEGHTPRLSNLSGGNWQQIKQRAKRAVRKMARELLELYALRGSLPAYAFSTDTPWQHELESSFEYEETPDQLRATSEIKEDMEASRPMDRLVCGDVGYGKTEVAVRSAFKAILDSKQVAILVPTTILAQQHLNTFQERFSPFPIRVEMLSRFKTPREQRDILKDLKQGKIDVVIGTHRLIQKDVEFHDLGLVIIDEEQRFGVVHKERLKELRKTVDVLTMTATPIPRTLHMSLAGIRDMSIINTPPEDRLPIATFVVPFDRELITEAILRELSRGGQVYFVHNRVQSIASMASFVQRLVPQARVAIAHGQMRERELEHIMTRFIEEEYDILVCTTIIESGLDITNVNTIIVDGAHYLGLAQLYQLRGRVGRAKRQAYVYFLYPRGRALSEVAEKRLQAIREFTELGSGFKLAMRDLEIRGAGNILGAEQHGHLIAVGFEMYCRLLAEAVKELKGEGIEIEFEKLRPSIDLKIQARIPDDYISSPELKIEAYRKMAYAEKEEEIKDLEWELEDRYGAPPTTVRNLLKVILLRILAKNKGIRSLSSGPRGIAIELEEETRWNKKSLEPLLRQYQGRLSLSGRGTPRLLLNNKGASEGKLLSWLEKILRTVETERTIWKP